MISEDGITERICLSESIEGCLTAIGWTRLEKIYSDDDSIRVVVLKFDSEDMDPKYLKSPEDLDDLVADAYLTREWWYELPIHPTEVEIKLLSHYDSENIEYILPIHLREVSILSEDDHQKYCENGKEVVIIENLRWKDEIY